MEYSPQPRREVLEIKKRVLAKLMQVGDPQTLSLVERLLDGCDEGSGPDRELMLEILSTLRNSDAMN